MNGIEALEELKNAEFFVDDDSWCGCTCYYPLQNEDYEENFKLIEKDLKVLQILKDKDIDLRRLKINIDLDIDFLSKWFRTTPEEMTLIVEWLKEE